jgi:hypothetical protein
VAVLIVPTSHSLAVTPQQFYLVVHLHEYLRDKLAAFYALETRKNTSKYRIGSSCFDEQKKIEERDLIGLESKAHSNKPVNDRLCIF